MLLPFKPLALREQRPKKHCNLHPSALKSALLKKLAPMNPIKNTIHAVGSEQAKSLQNADTKIIANRGSATNGITKVMDLFSSKDGTSMAAAVEAIAQSDIGVDLLNRLTN